MKDYELVRGYRVKWGLSPSSENQSSDLGREMQTYMVDSGLTAGQQYVLNVISIVDLTKPSETIYVESLERKVRIGMFCSTLFISQ